VAESGKYKIAVFYYTDANEASLTASSDYDEQSTNITFTKTLGGDWSYSHEGSFSFVELSLKEGENTIKLERTSSDISYVAIGGLLIVEKTAELELPEPDPTPVPTPVATPEITPTPEVAPSDPDTGDSFGLYILMIVLLSSIPFIVKILKNKKSKFVS
jgi:hypothetical protein